ncbi:bifunctional dihydropteridine reductase/dihydrofolate reductase TmpR [Candidatus Woesearchaeota archaeon]|nr:bifunctional dihydropteridine reductase/dihydrofolate reductase TmpR [Candidatus Woesearchaeota archaeon]
MKGAIVTGAARGLGKAIALMLANEGYAVAINYNKSRKEAAKTLKELRKINGDCICVKGDLTNEKNVKRLVTAAKKKFGRIDVLVNNIGDFLYKPLLKTTSKEVKDMFENNSITVFSCSKEAIKIMKKQKRGRIVNIGSVGCTEMMVPDKTTPYYIGKTGVWLLTKALAKAAPKGVTVNMVSPGILKTSVVKPKGAKYTDIREVAAAVSLLIHSNHNGKNVTVAKWKPDG